MLPRDTLGRSLCRDIETDGVQREVHRKPQSDYQPNHQACEEYEGAEVEVGGPLAYQIRMIEKISRMAGWLALAFIAYATLSPIDVRPTTGNAHFEHFVAFGLVGLALGIGYPKRPLWVAAIVIASALTLEGLQFLTPDRHARLLDASVKAASGLCGVGISQLVLVFFQTRIDRAS